MNVKIGIVIFILVAFACNTYEKKGVSRNLASEKPLQNKIENRKYFVGDYDNDKVNDTAFVNYKLNIETNEIECEKNNCEISITFKENIPKIGFAQSTGVVVAKTLDVNNDSANEIIVFSKTNEGWWNKISVWSFKKGIWLKIAETNAFISDEKDFENRIIKENGSFYLIGQNKWKEDENGNFKEVKVKL